MLHKITGKLGVCVCVHACVGMHIDMMRGRITVVYFVFLARYYIAHGLPGLNIAFENRYKGRIEVHCHSRILGGQGFMLRYIMCSTSLIFAHFIL